MSDEGIAVTYDGLISGTLDSHRLAAWAQPQGKENELVEEVMKQYFELGKHPGDKAMLAEAAGAAGLDQEAAAAFLETDEGAIEVNLEAARVRNEYGVTGVPFFVFRGMAGDDEGDGAIERRPMGVSGAQDAETLVRIMNKAMERPEAAPSM